MTNRIAEIAARCEAATPGPWDDKLTAVYKDETAIRICGEFYNFDADAFFVAQARQDIPYLLSQLAERDRTIERLREAIASVHKSLDFADGQRQSCKNYTELAINNGLALGRIAVTLKHDFKEPLPEPPEDIYKAEAEAALERSRA